MKSGSCVNLSKRFCKWIEFKYRVVNRVVPSGQPPLDDTNACEMQCYKWHPTLSLRLGPFFICVSHDLLHTVYSLSSCSPILRSQILPSPTPSRNTRSDLGHLVLSELIWFVNSSSAKCVWEETSRGTSFLGPTSRPLRLRTVPSVWMRKFVNLSPNQPAKRSKTKEKAMQPQNLF